MTTTDIHPQTSGFRGDGSGCATRPGWFARAEGWLDDHGKGAWIAAMVVGFIVFWPIGLAFLAYMIWSKRMFTGTRSKKRAQTTRIATTSSGNRAFDAYKADTLRRLEQEQASFEAFLERLREAKDKAEFDQFMDDRARRADVGDSPRAPGDDAADEPSRA